MNKLLIPIAFAGAGTATASSVGIYVSNRNSSDKSKGSTDNKLIFESIDDFKAVTDVSGHDCLKDYFSGLDIKTKLSGSVADITDSSPAENDFFQSADSSSDPFKGCLVFNWRKTAYDNGKWTGKMTWLWTFVKGDEGFINFNVAETSASEDQKLTVTGLFYLLKKESGAWVIKHKKEVTTSDNKTADSTHLPKATSSLKSHAGSAYWGFLDDSGGLTNVIKPDSAAGNPGTTSVKKFSFVGSSSASTDLKGWCESLDWFTKIYSSSNWKVKAKLEALKGSWSFVS